MLGWVCTYTPEEIFATLGLESYRLYGDDRGEYAKADLEYLPVNFCPLGRACLNEGMGKGNPSLTGIVLAASCHALVHLAGAFKYAGERRGKEFFVHLLDLPRTSGDGDAAVRAFASSLRSLAGRLSSFYGVAWNDGAFYGALQAHQSVRRLLRELYRLRMGQPENFRAAGLLEVVRAAGRAKKDEFLPVLDGIVKALKGDVNGESRVDGSPAAALLAGLRRGGSPQGPRLLVVGSPLPFAYLDLIEELGGNIAGDDLCQGYRYCLPEVEEGPDPFLSLARGYLGRVPCPRMLAGKERFSYLLSLARKAGARGVIYHALKFCDASLYEYPLFREYFAEAGIPVLYLETEYRDAGLEQARTRIQAYLELL
ncbi:MAG TPA: 2-hydroxyacyl-CoA dehydratase [Syntrophomonadaceae bacterium]|nr:2-hydroxyacyl-CoA dehydratase [Syntrophomonadaceae bacterium]